MYHGKHEAKRIKRRRRSKKKAGTLLLFLLLIAVAAVGGTIAYLAAKTDSVDNKFSPSHVTCEVTESFDGTSKSNVNVENTGDTEAYIRVKLVSYRVNDAGQHIGGTAEIPSFTPGANWVAYGGYYYYTMPVAPDESPANALIGNITLTSSYTDTDGGKQAVDVLAEAIQSGPAEAVGDAWGVSIAQGSVTAYQGG
jgi:hypothetical protein